MKHETIDCRQDARRPTYVTGRLRIGSASHPCWIRDLSAGGALIFAEVPVSGGDRMVLEVNEKALAAYVRWTDYPLLGVQFEKGSMVVRGGQALAGKGVTGSALRAGLSRPPPAPVTERLRRWWNGR